ncbi:TetR family transcriptional regulator [Kitasatospora sp. NBC_01287]|uniref:TetR family transcriptional regulator n=1 Tax=Kitasatospora sp. NBC_01287 TaxID=2903573 RepID=UPI002259E01A|nr:TetR/AcrR family transcriptional regulator [Kitasatospora sp. NBC_01287]MCX4745709.1 TetR family transcriptional regulator [Kitasatospora sp. NBC_01287]
MNEAGPGRREQNKRRTHHALEEAATRLFREQGYEATTVRDIAQAAGVGERTFFRYFPSKESLIVQQVRDIIPLLAEEISARPAAEPPLAALREAVLELSRRYDTVPAILLVGPQPLTPHPTSRGDRFLLFDLEEAVAAAFLARLAPAVDGGADGGPDGGPDSAPEAAAVLRAAVLSRAGVGVLRAIRLTYNRMSLAQRESLDLAAFACQAFAELE